MLPPPELQISNASSGNIYTTRPLNFKKSAISVQNVKEFFTPHKESIAYIKEVEEPGLLVVEIFLGKVLRIATKRNKIKEYMDKMYTCGLCLLFHSDRKNNLKQHLFCCKKNEDVEEKQKQMRIRKNQRQQKWRLKRKMQSVCQGRPLPKRHKKLRTDEHAAENAETTEVNNFIEQSEASGLENQILSSFENSSGTSDNNSDSDSDIVVETPITRNCDTYINLGDPVEKIDDIFDVRDINFVHFVKSNFENSGKIWRPRFCSHGYKNNQDCNVYFHGYMIRTRVFAFPLPYFIRHRQLMCRTHNTTFNYFCDEVADQIPSNVFPTEDIVVFERTVMSRDFLYNLVEDYQASFNATRIHKTVTLKWVRAAITRLKMQSRRKLSYHLSSLADTDNEFHKDLPEWDVLTPLRSLSPGLIMKIVQAWWAVEKEEYYQSWKLDFYNKSKRLSGDHTYKCVRSVGTYEVQDGKKQWVGVKASLYTIMNQDGHLVDFKICPSDAFVHVEELLGDIWSTQALNNCFTSQFHTDNVAKDRNQILRVFSNHFPTTIPELSVVQDLFHAEQRVERKMNKSSKQYFIAKLQLKSIFSAFKKTCENGGYRNKEEVVEVFQNWVYQFMSNVEESLLSDEEQLKLVGASLTGCTAENVAEEVEEEEELNERSEPHNTYLNDYTEEHLSLLFETETFKRAEDIVSNVAFCTYTCPEERHVFRCGITGSHHKVYFVTMHVSNSKEGSTFKDQFECRCICPSKSSYYKHIAAGLLNWKRNPSKWEKCDSEVVKPGNYSSGAVNLETVQAVNNILKENVLPYLMILATLSDTRGRTLNENFHRFIGTEIGSGSGICSLNQKEMDLKMCHFKFNNRQKKHSELLKNEYMKGCSTVNDEFKERPPTYSYLMYPKIKASMTKKDLQDKGFKTKNDKAIWTETDIELLKNTLMQLYTGDYQILSKNPYYWIAHHTFDDTKLEKDVKLFVRKNYMNFTA